MEYRKSVATMSRKIIRCSLNHNSLQSAIQHLEEYQKDIKRKNQIFIDKLAQEGIQVIQTTMESIPSEEKGSYYTEVINNEHGDIVGAAVRLSGDKVLFIEFSAGISYGTDSYPLPSGADYGVGTYPDQKHAYDPNGWWYVDESGQKHHSYGNRAYMPMYHAEEAIIIQIRHIAKEVFGN
jgi:hypothetical protein